MKREREREISIGALFWGLSWTLIWMAVGTIAIGIVILKGG